MHRNEIDIDLLVALLEEKANMYHYWIAEGGLREDECLLNHLRGGQEAEPGRDTTGAAVGEGWGKERPGKIKES